MHQMFSGCTSFNSSLSSWQPTMVMDMGGMFLNCTNFNQPLNSWNTPNVTNMKQMFSGCTRFNQPLDGWTTRNVSDMSQMFLNCTSFNQPLDRWVTNKVTGVYMMFSGCTEFNQDLRTWKLSGLIQLLLQNPDVYTVQLLNSLSTMFQNCNNMNLSLTPPFIYMYNDRIKAYPNPSNDVKMDIVRQLARQFETENPNMLGSFVKMFNQPVQAPGWFSWLRSQPAPAAQRPVQAPVQTPLQHDTYYDALDDTDTFHDASDVPFRGGRMRRKSRIRKRLFVR